MKKFNNTFAEIGEIEASPVVAFTAAAESLITYCLGKEAIINFMRAVQHTRCKFSYECLTVYEYNERMSPHELERSI